VVGYKSFKAKNFYQVESQRQTVEVYGEGVMKKENVKKWC
jgi:hypothetical protein